MYSNIYQSKQVTFKSIAKLLLISTAYLLTVTIVLLRPSLVLADGGITVTTIDDEYSDPGPGDGCSLREAIQSANNDSDFGGCIRSGTAPYTITVPSGIYTLTLTGASEDNNAAGDLDLRASMTLAGAGADQTILDGNGSILNDRVLHLPTSGPDASLLNITIRNGDVGGRGGGIENNGMLNIRTCSITNNTSSDGGGISNRPGATLNILNSAITGNTSYHGGGIDNYDGTLNIANSTVSGNRSEDSGGGIRAHGGSHTSNLTHVTVTNNTADTDNADGGDGGGIKHSGGPAINVKNSLVAGNSVGSSGSGPDCANNYASDFNSSGYNLIGNNSGCSVPFPAGNPNTNNDYVGTGSSPFDPQLDGLTGNPGYHPLQANSPAVEKIPSGNCTFSSSGTNSLFSNGAPVTTDQRGKTRPRGGQCDIGAFEAFSYYFPIIFKSQ